MIEVTHAGGKNENHNDLQCYMKTCVTIPSPVTINLGSNIILFLAHNRPEPS